MNVNLKLVFCLAITGIAANTYAQQPVADSSHYSPVNNTIAYFKENIGIQSGLYNGQEYIFYSRSKDDNVFFQNHFVGEPGMLNYDGTTYTDVPLLYDLFKNRVVALLFNKYTSYMLVNEKITDFTISNHRFVYRTTDSLATNGFKADIYDQIYNGKTEVLVKREKTLLITSDQKNSYILHNKIFIKRGDFYYAISSRGSILKVLKDKNKELRKFITGENISFKDDKELAFIKIAAYYDKLTQ